MGTSVHPNDTAGTTGPWSCTVCGEGRREGCWRCGAKHGHHHLDVVDRHGRVVTVVAACAVHGALPQANPRRGRLRRVDALRRDEKRRRDRERRAAQRRVLDRYALDVDAELDDIRRGGR